ncbi:penicillin-binding protein 2 [Ferruginibacter lapsinanis]|uniref:peptidoglycan D,D-transpeptidase FtsI family protein n=1 Tax=Ferruginibacter lapsinanis TaxID=563172 RepID=UPI001E48C716|nr:penicillin-binding transpeptidase domain-containing protein [Ferruginibacter lapsinanis]UEG50478.1 penicillin-binding protein 2 [Ferruginibacter lapsinanis]
MPAFNQSRKNIIRMIFVVMFIIIIARLFTLQVITSKYRIMADDQGKFRKVIYPDRGIVFDRNRKAILENTTIYDLMVVPNKVRGIDTFSLCKILNLDTAQFNKKIVELIIKNGRSRPSIFDGLLSDEKMAKLNEAMYKFSPGFYLQERSVRSYPFDAAGNILGYLSEVDTNFLKSHPDDGYQIGDYAGKTGIERTYEKVLMGQRGIQYWKRDNKNRLTERLEKGRYDTAAVAGQNMYTSLDIELQELGEKLMENKLGSIVAVDPKTGGILCMVSSPTFKPKLLTGAERKKHIAELLLNPALPLLNRTVGASYSPGSTFKTLQALVGLHEGVITTDFKVSCGGAFYGCGSGKPMRCLDFGTFDLRNAIRISDNTYFATVMQRVINNPKYPNIDSSLAVWDRYMYAFGLGHKLGVDVPSEKRGNIPTPAYFNKVYGNGKWNYCSFRSVSIGQGEVDVTPIQVANEMAFIANKGWYKIPHLVDSIEGGDKFDMLSKFKDKHNTTDIPDSVFEAVHDGMQGVVDNGTGVAAKVKGIVVCGKTGTVENYYRGVKQPNHAFFCGFAPRDNPKIAIMCVVENSGRFGGTYAAPIVGLMIEKYLNDSITDKARLARIDQLSKLNLIPKRIFTEMQRQDSLMHAKDSAYLIAKGYIKIIKDTLDLDAEDEADALDKMKKDKELAKKDQSKKDSGDNKLKIKSQAILPDERKRAEPKDTVRI